MHPLALIIVGLTIAVNADVSHVVNHHHASHNTLLNHPGQPFTKQQQSGIDSHAGNGNRYWWAETPNSPFSVKSHTVNTFSQNDIDTAGCGSGCAQNILHNTQQQKQQHDYSHNPFMNGQYRQNVYAQMASLSGTPTEVNNLMTDTTVSGQYRFVPKIPCYGASQVCAPKGICRNGFISESDLTLVYTQANVSYLFIFLLAISCDLCVLN
jgi:hypothetical protein